MVPHSGHSVPALSSSDEVLTTYSRAKLKISGIKQPHGVAHCEFEM
jgi:hypothetical protein